MAEEVSKKLQLVGKIWGALLGLKSDKAGRYIRVSGIDKDGAITALEAVELDVNAPVFDLAALGLSAIPPTGGSSAVQADTTEIMAALDKGPVAFVLPFSMGDVEVTANLVVNGTSTSGMYQCIAIVNHVAPGVVTVNISDGSISVNCSSILDFAGVPDYVDSYINEALGGDY